MNFNFGIKLFMFRNIWSGEVVKVKTNSLYTAKTSLKAPADWCFIGTEELSTG